MATILIIDDEKPIRRLLRKTLEGAGYEVIEARNGQEGLRLYRLRPTDLVITDLLTPENDGLESIHILRREYPGAKIVAMTGGTGESNFLDTATVLGAHRTLAKPFSLVQLLGTVRTELEETAQA
jgi:two-component system chemotaxis response regulator CheY